MENKGLMDKNVLGELLTYAHLELGDTSRIKTKNPFEQFPDEYWLDQPHLAVIKLMMNPEYFPFTCRHILGVEILPFQHTILKELWGRAFPMLVGSRGLSKCTTEHTYITTNSGFFRIGEVLQNCEPMKKMNIDNLNLFGEIGYKPVEYAWNNGVRDTIKIKTDYGFELEGTEDHPVRVVRNGEIAWVTLENIKIGDRIPIQRRFKWFENTNNLTEDEAYFMGLIIGDGGYTIRGRISFTTADKELSDEVCRISQKLFGKTFKKDKSKYGWNLYGAQIWDDLFQKYGFNSSVCGKKDFPTSIKSAKKHVLAAFIRGLFDTDGTITKDRGIIKFCAKSKNIVDSLQFALSLFGITSKQVPRLNKVYNRYYHHLYIYGRQNLKLFYRYIGFGLSRKRNLLLNELNRKKKGNPNKDVIPHSLTLERLLRLRNEYAKIRETKGHGYLYERQMISPYRIKSYEVSYKMLRKMLTLMSSLKESEDWKFLNDIYQKRYFYDTVTSIQKSSNETFDFHIPDGHSYISNGFISHNTFMLSVYSLLRALLIPKRKIILCGAAFRQAKLIFEYADSIIRNSKVLQDICGTDRRAGARRDIDRVTITIGESEIIGLPLGDGSKIRGLRSHDTICDEFSCLEGNTLVETSDGIFRIKDTNENFRDLELINKNGMYETPILFNETPPTDAYKITVRNGYSFICSAYHKVETTNGFKIAKDLTEEDFLWFDNKYKFPEKYIQYKDITVDENLGWLMGILQAEGDVTRKNSVAIVMNDKNCIDRIHESFAKIDNSITGTMNFREAHTTTLGWECKDSYGSYIQLKELRPKLEYLGLDRVKCYDKKIPWSILQSPRKVILRFLAGLFEGDGCAYLFKDQKNPRNVAVCFYSVSEQFAREVQFILSKLDLHSTITSLRGTLGEKRLQYTVRMMGIQAKRFLEMVNVKKWEKILENCIVNERSNGISWSKKDKRWLVHYTINKKHIRKYSFATAEEAMEWKIKNVPKKHLRVYKVEKLEGKHVLYDYGLPFTHSFYGNGFIQHNSIPPEIYSIVISGFGAVSSNPVEAFKEASKLEALKQYGIENPEDILGVSSVIPNQSIIAGTASYAFENYGRYWQRYKAIIESQGDPEKLKEIFHGEVPTNFNWKDYSVIRVPYQALPKNFMDEKTIMRAKATSEPSQFAREYLACFPSDSQGFFKRSLIVRATARMDNPLVLQSGPVKFEATLNGSMDRKYIIGIDPASEKDNFAIVVLEIWPDHRRVVYGWTITRQLYKQKIKEGAVPELNYYDYCARKIRDLMKVFPCDRIAIDSQGGGIAVMESLSDNSKLQEGERRIWPLINDDKPKDTDDYEGLHIVDVINFSNAQWVSEANHGLKRDLQDNMLFMPYLDPISLELAHIEDEKNSRHYDTLEDATMEIEALRDELCTIVMTCTSSGRESWDTPETKTEGSKKGRLRKDRYSALLMANMTARQIHRAEPAAEYNPAGGVAGQARGNRGNSLYVNAPAWAKDYASQVGVNRHHSGPDGTRIFY